MKTNYNILAINPGSTSTKIAVFCGNTEVIKKSIDHNDQEISSFPCVWDQYGYRKKEILSFLAEEGFDLSSIDCVVGRGGLFRPTVSGTYSINEQMLSDAREGIQGEHASNLGCVIAYGIGWDLKIPSYIVDPPCVDELDDIARFSGHRDISRRSLFHALNVKAVARRAALELNKSLQKVNLIVTHIGGGISVVAIREGRMVDTNNALNEGPFSAERSGSLPILDFLELIRGKNLSQREITRMLVGGGGMVSYLGTKSIAAVTDRIKQGDKESGNVLSAMGYQISKEIGGMTAVLKGKVDMIVLTGGAAHSGFLVNIIKDHAGFIAPVIIYPGEDEMAALSQGALRVLNGEEEALSYPVDVKLIDGIR